MRVNNRLLQLQNRVVGGASCWSNEGAAGQEGLAQGRRGKLFLGLRPPTALAGGNQEKEREVHIQFVWG